MRQRWSMALVAVGLLIVVAAAMEFPALVARHQAMYAALGTLISIIAMPYALFDMRGLKDQDGMPITPWYFMLSEPHGGWSLSRVQLFIWFVPAITIYVALSVRDGNFAPLSDQMAILLGLGGATSFVSTAVTPPPDQVKSTDRTAAATPQAQPQAPAQPAASTVAPGAPPDIMPEPAKAVAAAVNAGPATMNPVFTFDRAGLAITDLPRTAATPISRPRLRDLVTDFDNHGDMSRYQYLLLCLIGAGLMVMLTVKTGKMPEIPTEFLYLVGISQASYVGTKAVKRVAIGNANQSGQGSGQA